MAPALAEHVHAARTRHGLIFLDVRRDAYSCIYLPPRSAGCGGPEPVAPPLLAQLRDEGLLATADATTPAWPCAADIPDWIEPAPNVAVRLTVRDIARFGRALLRATIGFHRRSFDQLILRGTALATQGRRSTADQSIAAGFELLCLFLPFRMQCLFRSWFLLHYLRTYGLSADWVFAATLFPFHAHCWLADGERLIGERIGQVEDLAPILILGSARG
jgi:hypothetical protein